MPSQPFSWTQRAPTRAGQMVTYGYVFLVAVFALQLWSLGLAHEEWGTKLTASSGRRLQQGSVTTQPTRQVIDATDLFKSIEDATENGSDSVTLELPSGTLVLNSTLKITTSVTLLGAPATTEGPGTALSCGPGNHSLIEFSGSTLLLVGLQIQDCKGPGIHILSPLDASITIEGCSFQNFSRELGLERVDVLSPGSPADISDSTFALAVHAGAFSGNLTVRNSRFVENYFSLPSDARRRLYGVPSSSLTGGGNQDSTRRQLLTGASAASAQPNEIFRRALPDTEMVAPGIDGGISAWGATTGSSTAGASWRRRRLVDDGSKGQYSMPLLERANIIHPGLQVGPWADDLEAVFTVVCRKGAERCAITFEDSIFDNNIGVATGALYVLCDGAVACDVDMANTTITNNRALWQPSTQILFDKAGATPDAWNWEDYGPLTPGVELLTRMASWITYTYPLLEYYKTNGQYNYLGADNLDLLPKVVGRTLGAVVFHQRNSPWPGVLPSEPRPMMRVNVTGGLLSSNDGAAIMSTAADWMQMAGGNGSWSGGPPRHSADISFSGIDIHDHASGWPAIWVRWARNVEMRDCQVTRSTGAAWFDEIRDFALVEDSVFEGNSNTDTYIDYLYFLLQHRPLDIGVDASQLLRMQMTPLGTETNRASVRGCRFEGNPSITSGVVYFVASDYPQVDPEDQPGRTSIEVYDSTFANNFCTNLDPDGKCVTGERPLYVYGVYTASVQLSRFLRNTNGGAAFASIHQVSIEQAVFDGNNMTYSAFDSATDDNSFGGAGAFGESIGAGGFNIMGTNFTRNYASVGGGAVFLRFFDNLQATDSRFEGNTAASYHGGAIWLEVSHASIPSELNRCIFESNTAGENGGAVYAYSIVPPSGRPTGWKITSSDFNNNAALLNPSIRGGPVVDQAGGGAIFGRDAAFSTRLSNWNGNKVLAHAGGAIRLVDSTKITATNCTFTNNVAVMGGAVALSRMSDDCFFDFCTFTNNTVVEPSWQSSTAEYAPSLSFIDPGYGGAFYTFSTSVIFGMAGEFTGNSAKFGGAIAVVSSPALTVIDDGYEVYKTNILHVNVSRDVAESVGLTLLGGSALPYRYLFANNTALIGGAMYLYDTESIAIGPLNITQYAMDETDQPFFGPDGKFVETEESARLQGQPAIVFSGNTANGGGAAYLEGNGQVKFINCRFAGNKAVVPPIAANFSGLYGLEKDFSMAKALPCYNGGGGAICILGQASKTLLVKSSDMVNNFAKDGAGMFIAEGLDCVNQANCYNVTLSSVNMTGNSVTHRGGGVFWMHAGVLNIASCPSDKQLYFKTNGTTLFSRPEVDAGSGNNVTLHVPVRKAPNANWYPRLTVLNQKQLLSTVGGAVSSPVHAVNGEVVVEGNPVFVAADADMAGSSQLTVKTAKGTIAVDGTYLTPTGHLVLPNSSNGEALPGWVPVGGRLIVFNNTFLPDPSWFGVPYNNLPCANWNNSADTGSDISTTPYFLLSPLRLDYYTSNTDIKINVTVHDWLGEPCTGGNDAQPLVLVQADSTEVSGSVTVPAVNGTAAFTTMRLRAREGLHRVTMTGRSHTPGRDLLTSELQVYVRPCAINEFLSPKNLDECIPCDSGSYNFNMSAVACMACPENADCLYPDPAACKLDTGCDNVGYLVPQDGYWHSNFFSEEVIECTNSDACKTPSRSSALSKMQLAIWTAARKIQLDASTAVANLAAKEALAELLSSIPVSRRRLLQEKALSDNVDVLLILNTTAAMLPEYMQTQCSPGYTGTLCGECAEGYGWRRIATCSKCPTRALNNLYYALVTLLTLSLLAFTVYSSLKEQRRPGLLVGGVTTDKSKASKPSKVNHAGRGAGGSGNDVLGVQASGPSQFHTIIAAAAVEDAAAEVAPALALLRERSYNPVLGDADLGNPYEYVDPALAAARNQYASAPGTPKNRPASPAPFPVFDTAIRSHSVLGVPTRASRWPAGIDDPRRSAASFSRMDNRGGVAGASPRAGAGGSSSSAPRPGGAGPVAEGAISGYDNALYEGPVAPSVCSATGGHASALGTEIQPVEEVVEEVEEGYRKEEILAMAAATTAATVWPSHVGRRPVAESKDYTNALYEGPRPMEADSTGGIAASSLIGAQAAATTVTRNPEAQDNSEGRPVGRGNGGDGDAPTALMQSHQIPPGVMMQSVPVLQSNSPPQTPRHASMTSVPPAALELPTVLERTRLNEIPRRGTVVGRERAHQSTVVKIFLSYIQVLALLQNVPLEIPGVVDVYYRINNQAISYPGILVSLDCSVPNTSVSKAFVRVILTVLAPLYIFMGAVVWFMIFNVIDYYFLTPYYAKHPSKKNRKRHLQLPSFKIHLKAYLGRQLIVTFITIFFFFYPSVVQSLMTIFNCQDVNVQTTNNPLAIGLGLHTERIWSQDYGQTCYTGRHLALVLGLGVPGVILIAIGWPLLSGLFMMGKLSCMNNISLTEDMTSFFLADFKARFAWWESVIMLRKLFIAVIVTLVDGSTSAGVQLLLVICVLVIASGIHLAAMPYHHTYTNNLELMSLGTLLATLYFSLYFGFSTSISNGGRVAISILILVINIIMVLVFVYYIVQAYYYAALCKTGLSDLDSETRRKLTATELRQRILENLNAQGSTTSFQDGSTQQQQQQLTPGSQRPRSSHQHVASFYTAAVWASMRMGSTTSKVLTKVRTLLREPSLSNPPSREGSLSGRREPDGVIAATVGGSVGAALGTSNSNQLNSHDSDAILGGDDDPEAARGSAAGRKRALSGPGASTSAGLSGNAGNAADNSNERTSLTVVKAPSGREPGVGRSQSQSSPGIDAACTSPRVSFAASPRDHTASTSGRGGGSKRGGEEAETAAVTAAATLAAIDFTSSPREAAKVMSRGSSVASVENPGLPAAFTELDGPITTQAAAQRQPSLPTLVAAAPLATSPSLPTSPRPNVRAQSRLAQASGQADRSGELLPPPPSFPGRGVPKP